MRISIPTPPSRGAATSLWPSSTNSVAMCGTTLPIRSLIAHRSTSPRLTTRTTVSGRRTTPPRSRATTPTSPISTQNTSTALAVCRGSSWFRKVDGPDHRAAEALLIRPLLLLSDSLEVIVADPLVIERDLLHHGVGEVFWHETPLLDQSLDVAERHESGVVCAFCGLAGAGELAADGGAFGVRDCVASSVVGYSEVYFRGVDAVEPEGEEGGGDFADVGLAADDGCCVPWTVEVVTIDGSC